MRKAEYQFAQQNRLIEHFVAGTTAKCAAELICIPRKTAAYYFQRVREITAHHIEQKSHEVFAGKIEVDGNPPLKKAVFKSRKFS